MNIATPEKIERQKRWDEHKLLHSIGEFVMMWDGEYNPIVDHIPELMDQFYGLVHDSPNPLVFRVPAPACSEDCVDFFSRLSVTQSDLDFAPRWARTCLACRTRQMENWIVDGYTWEVFWNRRTKRWGTQIEPRRRKEFYVATPLPEEVVWPAEGDRPACGIPQTIEVFPIPE